MFPPDYKLITTGLIACVTQSLIWVLWLWSISPVSRLSTLPLTLVQEQVLQIPIRQPWAGLSPAHGCRMGICNTCSCTKVSGSVLNLLTGEIDHNHNTQIKLCVTQAISPVVINL